MYEDVYCEICSNLVCQICGCCWNPYCEMFCCPDVEKEEIDF